VHINWHIVYSEYTKLSLCEVTNLMKLPVRPFQLLPEALILLNIQLTNEVSYEHPCAYRSNLASMLRSVAQDARV